VPVQCKEVSKLKLFLRHGDIGNSETPNQDLHCVPKKPDTVKIAIFSKLVIAHR